MTDERNNAMTTAALPLETPREARFWDRIAERYAAKPVADVAAYEKKLAIIREHLTPESRVFEFGCGTGSTAIALAPHAAEIQATDVSAKMIDIARRKAGDAGVPNVRFERAGIEELAVPEASVDLALGMSILHLLEDRRAAMEAAWTMLKPGGVFVSSTVCLGDGMSWFGLIAPLGRRLGLIPRVSILTGDALIDEIEAAGFEIERRWKPDRSVALFLVARKPA